MTVTAKIYPRFVGFFEGHSLVTLDIGGRPAWLALEIGNVLGYTAPNLLIDGIRGVASDPARMGRDFDEIGGAKLNVLEQELATLGVIDPKISRAACVQVLYFAGVERAILHSDHPGRNRLAAYMRDVAVPRFDVIAANVADIPLPMTERIMENRFEIERRRFESERLLRLVDELEAHGLVDEDVLMAYRVVATEIALGGDLSELKPQVAPGWQTPTEIAGRFDHVSPLRVGRVISRLGLRGAPGFSRAILNKAKHHDRTVISFVYSPEAVREVDAVLRAEGWPTRLVA